MLRHAEARVFETTEAAHVARDTVATVTENARAATLAAHHVSTTSSHSHSRSPSRSSSRSPSRQSLRAKARKGKAACCVNLATIDSALTRRLALIRGCGCAPHLNQSERCFTRRPVPLSQRWSCNRTVQFQPLLRAGITTAALNVCAMMMYVCLQCR